MEGREENRREERGRGRSVVLASNKKNARAKVGWRRGKGDH